MDVTKQSRSPHIEEKEMTSGDRINEGNKVGWASFTTRSVWTTTHMCQTETVGTWDNSGFIALWTKRRVKT